ncbi:class I SAM-dependent methyltransferase, partial [Escherichia coli]|nr:class I SAM-dependent methyltransferase [Escherichia coli]
NEMLVRHILDSIVVATYLQGERFIDVGTGPGVPGIQVTNVRPEANFKLLDSLGKRVRFHRQVKHELKLEKIEPVKS